MLQVIMDCEPLPALSKCFDCLHDSTSASQAMTGFQDLARLSAYFDQGESVSKIVRDVASHFNQASAGGCLTPRAQAAIRAVQSCIVQNVPLFVNAEWHIVLHVFSQLWVLDLLPNHLVELDDFSGADGRPLESLCDLQPPYPRPECPTEDATPGSKEPKGMSRLSQQDSSDGFFGSLTRWFEDETRDDEESVERRQSAAEESFALITAGHHERNGGDLPVAVTNPGLIHQAVRQVLAKGGLVDLFNPTQISKLHSESWKALAKALVAWSCPQSWLAASIPGGPAMGDSVRMPLGADDAIGAPSVAAWREVADPILALELLTNMACMPLGPGQKVAQIWPQVSTHFERLLQYVIAGGGGAQQQFIERLIVNTLRLCIRLIGNSELVPALLKLALLLSKLPERLFATYCERIACGLLVLVKESDLPHSGLVAIFALLKRIAELSNNPGACSAGIECLNYWLNDDQELARLLSLQQFPELLLALKAFASHSSSPAYTAALGHLSCLVPQLARGARNVPQARSHWQSLWVPTLHALADIAKEGSQKSSAQAFVYLQRLLLERGTDLALPWDEVPFPIWKECLEQVLFPLLQIDTSSDRDADGSRCASAAQLICRVVLTHMSDWLRSASDAFAIVFLRLAHILVSEASAQKPSKEQLIESLKNLLFVISADPSFGELASPNQGQSVLEAVWGVVSPVFPHLRQEIQQILCPEPMDVADGNAAELINA